MSNLIAWKHSAMRDGKLTMVHNFIDRVLDKHSFGFSENIDFALAFNDADSAIAVDQLEAQLKREPYSIEIYLIETPQPVKFRFGITRYHEVDRGPDGRVQFKGSQNRVIDDLPLAQQLETPKYVKRSPLEARPIDDESEEPPKQRFEGAMDLDFVDPE